MKQADCNIRRDGIMRNALWGILGGASFFATMMVIMMVVGPKIMSKMCGRMKNVMEMCANENSVDILKRRYARGEISREQFRLMKQELGN